MGVALVVTVDVEEDMPRWMPKLEVRVHTVMALPRLQHLDDDFGVRKFA